MGSVRETRLPQKLCVQERVPPVLGVQGPGRLVMLGGPDTVAGVHRHAPRPGMQFRTVRRSGNGQLGQDQGTIQVAGASDELAAGIECVGIVFRLVIRYQPVERLPRLVGMPGRAQQACNGAPGRDRVILLDLQQV